jgi:hypothetical protein
MTHDLPKKKTFDPSTDAVYAACLAAQQASDQDVLGSPAFAAFDEQMDQLLEQLVARWSHLAAPEATKQRRSSKSPVYYLGQEF